MKQSAAKTLGTVVLGAAFAAAGAGAAAAAPALPAVPADLPALDTVTQVLPAESLSTLSGAEQAADAGVTVVEQTTGLLGGLPLQSSVNGLPIG